MKPALTNARLYGILDLGYVDPVDAGQIAQSMIDGGVDLIQLRGKNVSMEELTKVAARLHRMTSAASTPLVINDHAEIAAKIPVEGVHVGQDDESVELTRKKAGRAIVVGKSTHSLEQATAAQKEGADYIGFGPIFATPTKPDYQPIGLASIENVYRDVSIPIFCIGGIKRENLEQVIAAGARRVAIVSGLLKAEDIVKYARSCKNLLTSNV